jgi:DNA-binding MarR family transcriptional regulator
VALDSDIDQIHQAVITFARNVRNQGWDVYDGLSFVGYTLLEFIAQAECAHAVDLAGAYGLDKSTVSRQLAELENDGLLTRSADPSHPRHQRLELTSDGNRRLRRTRAAQRAAIKAELTSWEPRDVTTFATLFARFSDAPGPPRTATPNR